MFLFAQIIGIYVAQAYLPDISIDPDTGEEKKQYDLPYGIDPPSDLKPQASVSLIMISLFIAVAVMLLLMKLKAELFLRIWFLIVVIIGIALALNAFIPLPNSAFIALAIAIPLGLIKIFQRNLIIHNLTELLIYPGIASVFIPLLNIWAIVILLILISLYDMYAVWHAGFMQKMARYQIEQVRVFSGFFIPYLGKKDREKMKKAKDKPQKNKIPKKVKVNVAILGGGDVVFPILLSGVVLATLGLTAALLVAFGATAALAFLFYISEKGKFYPAMPFISAGCFVALGLAYLLF
jgi:presenilin-like A22 family membrane protease